MQRLDDSTYVKVLLTPKDKARLRKMLDQRQRSASPFVRELILEALDRKDAKQAEPARA